MLREGRNFTVPHCQTIYKELKSTPDRELKSFYMRVYWGLVQKDADSKEKYPMNTKIITLAESYFNEYYKTVKKRDELSQKKMMRDCEIVAFASYYRMEIVVSNDKRSMMSNRAMHCYNKVNEKGNKLKTPAFIKYKKFKRDLKNQLE